MAERNPQNAKEILPTATQVRLKNVQQFLQHALSCMDPECLLPHCVNMKLALKHTQGCEKTHCPVCQQMKSLASKHSESCADLYCCMPYCMEEKLRGFVQSHFGQIDGCLDAAPQSHKGEIVSADECSSSSRSSNTNSSNSSNNSRSNHSGFSEVPGGRLQETTARHNTKERPSLSVNSSNDSAPNQAASTQREEPALQRTNSYPPVNLKRISRSTSLNMVPVYAKSPRLHSEHRRCQSLVTQNSACATSQWNTFSAARADSLTTRTQTTPNPLFVAKGGTREKVATKQPSLKEISSASMIQSETTRQEIQKTTDLLNTACLSSVAEASRSIPSTGGHVTGDSKTLLKARLIHTLYNLLHLIMQKLETREEILICIKSLRNALHEIETLH